MESRHNGVILKIAEIRKGKPASPTNLLKLPYFDDSELYKTIVYQIQYE
jgi:hypothetical protein